MTKLFKTITMGYNDDDSISIRIIPEHKCNCKNSKKGEKSEKGEKDDDDKDDNGCDCGCNMGMILGGDELKASAKDISEALDKIKGIVGLSPKSGEKPKNIIAEYLKG